MNNTGHQPDSLPRRPRWTLVLLLYPFLLYALLTSGRALAEWFGVFSLGTLILMPGLRHGRLWAWGLLVVIGVVTAYAVWSGHQALVRHLPQILICSFLMVVFGRTLRPGHMPLITRISIAMRQGQSEAPLRYTRGLTIAWVAMFAALVLESVFLLLFAPDIPMSQINGMTYTIIVVALVVEFLYHSWRYPNPTQPGLTGFVKQLIQIDYRRLLSD